jgi:hypothetical protein
MAHSKFEAGVAYEMKEKMSQRGRHPLSLVRTVRFNYTSDNASDRYEVKGLISKFLELIYCF